MANRNGSGQFKLDDENFNYVPFDQTIFSEENKRALALLIMLFER